MEDRLDIVFKDGSSKTYKADQFTDYDYMKDVFVVLLNNTWIGIYSMDCVKYVEYYQLEINKGGDAS